MLYCFLFGLPLFPPQMIELTDQVQQYWSHQASRYTMTDPSGQISIPKCDLDIHAQCQHDRARYHDAFLFFSAFLERLQRVKVTRPCGLSPALSGTPSHPRLSMIDLMHSFREEGLCIKVFYKIKVQPKAQKEPKPQTKSEQVLTIIPPTARKGKRKRGSQKPVEKGCSPSEVEPDLADRRALAFFWEPRNLPPWLITWDDLQTWTLPLSLSSNLLPLCCDFQVSSVVSFYSCPCLLLSAFYFFFVTGDYVELHIKFKVSPMSMLH